MANFDVNNNYRGSFLGHDRQGFITPTCDASESLQPFLPVSYPAPWLPAKRQDFAHPAGANVVISDGSPVGQDKSGGLIPAGYRSGNSGDGGKYFVLIYGAADVGLTLNPQTGARVAAAGEYVVLSAPNDGAVGDNTAADASLPAGITITAPDLAFGKACNLIPGGVARAIGYAIRNVWQYIGAVKTISLTNGMSYVHDSNTPIGNVVHNYTYEMGTAIRTEFNLRVPWIGATPTTIGALATTDGIADFAQTDWSRSFTHFTGDAGMIDGKLFWGCSVVASDQFGAIDAGHYAPYDSALHKVDQICGQVVGIERMYPIRDAMDRVRTQFERAQELIGPFREPNGVQNMMGGSATRGLDYQLNLSTNGVFRKAVDQKKTIHDEYVTYVYIHFRK